MDFSAEDPTDQTPTGKSGIDRFTQALMNDSHYKSAYDHSFKKE